MENDKAINILFEDDLKQYETLLTNYESLMPEDMETSYSLAKMMILAADRWNEIAVNASKYSSQLGYSKSDFYNWAYHRYRVLMTLHEFCRVIYKKCADDLRSRGSDYYG